MLERQQERDAQHAARRNIITHRRAVHLQVGLRVAHAERLVAADAALRNDIQHEADDDQPKVRSIVVRLDAVLARHGRTRLAVRRHEVVKARGLEQEQGDEGHEQHRVGGARQRRDVEPREGRVFFEPLARPR